MAATPEQQTNLADLKRQAQEASRAEPIFPKLSEFTRGTCHPELQRAFELYDQAVVAQQKQRQVNAGTSPT